MKHSRFAEELYQKLTNEEDARVCKAIEERACREVPGNFLLMILSLISNGKFIILACPWWTCYFLYREYVNNQAVKGELSL